ncbi:MAG TPA: helix-turn-helix transcriptional regulator [Mycobacteriales bacterium]|jgi:DNA-binding PadR family transcriptional regulator|nr:helix-turn-helix transcriptional regulator [Mycobacteriales bacterium]
MTGNLRITATVVQVLGAFLEDPVEKRYGFDLIQATGQPSGTIYPILLRLEKTGWLKATWEDEAPGMDRPARRYYEITPDGLAAARTQLTALQQRLNRILGEQPA